MKKSFTFFLFIILGTLNLNAQIYSENESIVPEIKKGSFDKELVEIEGVVEFWERVPQKTTIRYWLRDYWGKLIPVQSVREHPIVNQKYRIEGTVHISNERLSYNRTKTRRFIDEHVREELSLAKIETPVVDVNENDEKNKKLELLSSQLAELKSKKTADWYYDYLKFDQLTNQIEIDLENEEVLLASQNLAVAKQIIENPSFNRLFYLAILLLILVLAIIIVLIFLLVNKNSKSKNNSPNTPQHREFDHSKLTVKTPEPEQTVGETIKMSVPPQGTLKVLKGRMEIIEGETELKEIRFYSLPSHTSHEFSFGRNSGTPYQHIQISNATVSRDQARLLYNNGTYTIINKADPISKNATKLNDVDIPLNEAKTLKPGDKISMGVITMVYREH